MEKRRLKRQLNLLQVVMLGTAGAIGAQIFVLTGYAAGMSGPASVLGIIIGGVLSYSIALNYGELASAFPETGGAMTYVREAWGRNLLSFLVGSLDCLSSTFFAALSAVGFAYSVQVFIPILPIVPTAITIILVFMIINIMGVGNVGSAQILLGGVLLSILAGYILLGFLLPAGFSWQTYLSQGGFFIYPQAWTNIQTLLSTVALVYVAYIGFEVIADDAEEIQNPDRNLVRGILVSLTICLIIYPLITLVTLGTIPWRQLAGSDVALTTAAARLLPGFGAPLLAFGGMIATLTTLNTAMLSATREAFTLSRDGMWPRPLCRLGAFRTPYVSILVIGVIIIAVASIGLVDFLSYISCSGYLFVLFWSNLALIRLRHRYPHLRRPYKVPLYPLTVYLAMGTCVFIISFTDRAALAFGVGLLAFLAVLYYLSPSLRHLYATRIRHMQHLQNRILVPVSHFKTTAARVRLAMILAQASEDTSLCVFNVTPAPIFSQHALQEQSSQHAGLPAQVLREARRRNVPMYSKIHSARSVAAGILDEIQATHNIKFLLTGYPSFASPQAPSENTIKILLEKAPTNLLVLLDRNLESIKNILVPVGGGVHSRLAMRVAYEIAEQVGAHLTLLHTLPQDAPPDEFEDKTLYMREIVVDQLGFFPPRLLTRIVRADTLINGILTETRQQPYDLLVMGASGEYASGTRLFGAVDDWLVSHVQRCSVLLVRQHESIVLHWLRRHIKRIEHDR